MIIVTHDHPDHLAALDAILALRHERRGRLKRMISVPSTEVSNPEDDSAATTAATDDPHADLVPADDRGGDRLLILGNPSIVNRYSFLNGGKDYVVMNLDDASVQRAPQLTKQRIGITALLTSHRDLGGHDALGFVFMLKPKGTEGVRIAFMSDTKLKGLYDKDEEGNRTKLNPRWRAALESEIVVAHMSDTPSGELRGLAFPDDDKPTLFDERP
jgi:hypothetical protein